MLPAHLAGQAPRGLVPGQPVAQWELGSWRNFVYLLLCWETKRAALVDPQSDLDTPLGALAEHGFELERVLLTHTHHDHVAGLPELLRRHPGLPVHLHADDLHRLRLRPEQRVEPVADGAELRVGRLRVLALHTPGHSAGHVCWRLPDLDPPLLLGGDCVFVRDCGRTDLETGDDAAMFASLQRLKRLPVQTVVLPGHHYQPECASTLQGELASSPPLRCASVEELRALP